MNPLETFLGGFLLGIFGTLLILWRRPRPEAAIPAQTESRPHTDEKAAADIGHERGIEVFDD